jgi:hypothetical protein
MQLGEGTQLGGRGGEVAAAGRGGAAWRRSRMQLREGTQVVR